MPPLPRNKASLKDSKGIMAVDTSLIDTDSITRGAWAAPLGNKNAVAAGSLIVFWVAPLEEHKKS